MWGLRRHRQPHILLASPTSALLDLTPSRSWYSFSIQLVEGLVGLSNVSEFLAQGNYVSRPGLEPVMFGLRARRSDNLATTPQKKALSRDSAASSAVPRIAARAANVIWCLDQLQ